MFSRVITIYMTMRKKLLCFVLLIACFHTLVVSCGKSEVKLPPDTSKTDPTTSTSDTAIVNLFNKAPVIVWIEAAANFSRLGTADKMAATFQKLADMGAKGIVLDVKGIPGLVSYNSQIAQQLKTWNGYTQADGFDYLQNAITEAKKKGLKVFVSMSVFAEGMNYYGVKYGKVFNDPSFSAIQSQVMTAMGTVQNITDVYSYGLLNPLQPLAQSYELSLIKEVVTNYNIDGFVLDYCRFYDICADFSDYTLAKFKDWAGLSSVKATDIVQSWTTSNGSVVPAVTGAQYKKWLEFRAQTIHDFVSKTRDAVKAIKPHLAFCSYSGAWYDSYYTVGVNWASKNYDPSSEFSWATSTYKNTGYAELLDMFMTGNYTPTLTGAGWWTVQGQIDGANRVLKNANIHYGAIDIGNTSWSDLPNMKNAIVMLLQQTKGVMLFDLVHIDDPTANQFNKQLYDDVKSAISQGLTGK
ncbi:MAG: family 10 glycosylhydrolase [Paludibacter sp.]|nr:family 10 glycosylhydrolase [Paludibacter sp.]